MNPDDDDAVINQLKHPRISLDVLPKLGIDFIRSLDNRRLLHDGRPNIDLQAFAEDEVVRKEYKEMRCQMPGTPRSTFLMVFSPDGTKVASTHGNHNIYVTDLKSGKNIKTLIGHPRTPWCIAFHPSCNELVASGCLGGQVRIWDLSGGSEVWTAGSQTVIASIAFHPNDRILVIATYNELYFWDWSKPQPFTRAATCSTKEKVRFVAFDKLGHKLITGIANTPTSRWERTRASTTQNRWERTQTSVPVTGRSVSPSIYRRRITPRLVNTYTAYTTQPSTSTNANTDRVPISSVPERERRITACYRNLVHEYELLVHRYLQVYRPPTTIDRGTDPMEMEQQIPDAQNPGPSTSQSPKPTTSSSLNESGPSTSGSQQSSASPSTAAPQESNFRLFVATRSITRTEAMSTSAQANPVQVQPTPRRRLVMRTTLGIQTSTESATEPSSSGSKAPDKGTFKMRIKCSPRRRSTNTNTSNNLTDTNLVSLKAKLSQIRNMTASCSSQIKQMSPKPSTSSSISTPAELTTPSSSTAPATSVPDRTANNNREPWRLPLKRLYPGFIKKTAKHNRKPVVIDTSSENSSSEEDDVAKKRLYCPIPQSPSATGGAASSSTIETITSILDPGTTTITTTTHETLPIPWSSETPSSSTGFRSEEACNRGGCFCQRNRTCLDKLICLTDLVAMANNEETLPKSNADSICDRCGGSIETQTAGDSESAESSTSNVVRLTVGNAPNNNTNNINPSKTETVTNSMQSTVTESQPNLVPSTSSSSNQNPEPAENAAGCARTMEVNVMPACARTLMSTETRTTDSTVYTPSSGSRRRFFSHVLSAFLPTRIAPPVRPRATCNIPLVTPPPVATPPPLVTPPRGALHFRGRSRSRNSQGTRFTITYAPDEVINFSERLNAEDELAEQRSSNLNEFHPFDPPPEFASINPENIGIGNMYSNIVQDLESSLNNVRNIRASNRPGETSDMLSSFSERLESIMDQSDSILRNLRHTMDMLPPTTGPSDPRRAQGTSPALPSSRGAEPDQPSFLFNDPNFYVRDHSQSNSERVQNASGTELRDFLSTTRQHQDILSNRSAIASDHTYPRNPRPRTPPPSSDNLTPLMTSLHLTISHIQRQARLLRRQVESIERIDRAMLEVAQVQAIRQMFAEIRRHLSHLGGSDNRSTGVSSVRQMMAGTRISDSSPCDSPAEDESNQNRLNAEPQNPTPPGVPDLSTTSSSSTEALSNTTSNPQPARQRANPRKSFPPSRLLYFQRQNRRFSVVNYLPRRYTARERLPRRRVYFRTFSVRPNPFRAPSDRGTPEGGGPDFRLVSALNSDYLQMMTRRLEELLTAHIRLIGRPIPPPVEGRNIYTCDNAMRGENAIRERLNSCRLQLNRLAGGRMANTETTGAYANQEGFEVNSVTPDGIMRHNAREGLSYILQALTTFFVNPNCTTASQSLRSQIRNVVDLTSLLSDILLLHIVDSIPPPTGMNLDPERESLSTRIDHMCTRMLHSRFGQSHNLTRSLRLMRLTARYASRALGQTYNMRRNAIFSSGNSSRRELLGQINSTLHSIHRNRGLSYTPIEIPSSSDPFAPEMPVREWYRTINALVSRYSTASNQADSNSNPSSSSSGSSGQNTRFGDATRTTFSDVTDDELEDAEPDWFNNNLPGDRRQPLYRTNNVNLLNNEEAAPSSSQSRLWNVPTVQINDIPISESNSAWHSRITQHRYRLSDLRSNPSGSLFRPRFLHPLYAGVNPFDADLDDPQREQMYDGDMILTVTPNHRIQAWDISSGNIPDISNSMKNVVVSECKIHNDASVDISTDGTILVTLLPSGGYLNVTNRLGVYSLRWETLGQCLYQTSFEQNAVSVSLSPLSRHLVVGLASRRVSIVPNDKWTMARIFLLNQTEMPYGSRLPVLRELEQNRDTNYMSLNCIRWLPVSGQGLIYATNTGQLRILT